MSGLPLEPIDELHRECLTAQTEIRRAFNAAWAAAARWVPRPMPEGWDGR